MNISIKTKRSNDKLISYLINSQRELINECHEDFKTKEVQDVVTRLKEKNKSLNGV